MPEADRSPIRGVSFSPDGQKLLSGWTNRTARVFDVATGAVAVTFEPTVEGKREACYYAVDYAPAGGVAATASTSLHPTRGGNTEWDHDIKVWNAERGTLVKRLHGHRKLVYQIEFSPDARQLASASTDTTVRLWDVSKGDEVRSLAGFEDTVYSVAFSADGKHVAAAGSPGIAIVWDVQSGEEIRRLQGQEAAFTGVAFSPNGAVLALTDIAGSLWLFELSSGRQIQRIDRAGSRLGGVSFSPDGRWIAMAETIVNNATTVNPTGRSVLVLDRETWQIATNEVEGDGYMWNVEFESHGDLIAAAGDNVVVLIKRSKSEQ